MKNNKKNLIYICFIFIFATLLSSCTTNETSIWCKGLNEVDTFSFNYSVIKNTYDWSVRNFSVKDCDKFETYLYSLKEFSTTFKMSDSKEQVFIFKHNGEKYEIVKRGNNEYYLSSCKFIIYDNENGNHYQFAFAPITYMYSYDTDGVIQTIQEWKYFSFFYKDYDNVLIDEGNFIITLPMYSNNDIMQITLTYSSNTISYSF